MAVIITGDSNDKEGRGSLACDVKGCKRIYRPRHGATDHETLQNDANKRGWDCYVEGPTFYDMRDLCPDHKRKAP